MRLRLSRRWLALTLGLAFAAEDAHARLVLRGVIVRGATKTKPSAVQARMRLRQGDRVDMETLKLAKERLMASELFTDVKATVNLPHEEAVSLMYVETPVRPVDLVIQVKEKHSWIILPTASLGAGDRSGGLVFAERNLLGHDVQLIGAGQIGESTSYIFAAYRDPSLRIAPLILAVSGIYRRVDIRFFADHQLVQSVPTSIVGGEMQLGYALSTHLSILPGTLIHKQEVDAAEELSLPEGDATPPEPLQCTQTGLVDASGQPVTLSAPYNCEEGKIILLKLDLIYDRTTAPAGLRRGIALAFRNDLSDSLWNSDFHYFKVDFALELYGYLWKTYPSAILRTRVIYPSSPSGVPLTQMLRLGGAELRGFLTDEFHGDTEFRLQLEEQVPLYEFTRLWKLKLVGAVFVDTGLLLERHPGGEPISTGVGSVGWEDVHMGVGGGLRFVLPGVVIPAVKFDVGYGIDVNDVAVTFSIARQDL